MATGAHLLRTLLVGASWLWLGWLAAACGDDGSAACAAGQQQPCSCGADRGEQICLADGTLTECDCRALRTVPCSAAGVAFDCSCADGRAGHEICLADGRYTSCDCGELPPAGGADASTAPMPTPPRPAPTPCPGGFSCVEQMGFLLCADSSGFPPLCQSAPDCVAAGLPDAACIDPMIGGVLICAQECPP